MRSTKFLALVLVPAAQLGFVLAGCNVSPLVPEHGNIKPVADARIIGSGGKPIDERDDDGAAMLQIELIGNEVDVTLDGSGSKDDDGSIVEYRWLSGTEVPVDGGVMGAMPGRRLVPEGEKVGWPKDEKKPKVTLGDGTWTFSLWVIDNKGAVSEPDTITVNVAPAGDAGVAE